jgi:hypothetical protein
MGKFNDYLDKMLNEEMLNESKLEIKVSEEGGKTYLNINSLDKDTRKPINVKKLLTRESDKAVAKLLMKLSDGKIIANTRDLIPNSRPGKLSSEAENDLVKLLLTNVNFDGERKMTYDIKKLLTK